MKFAVHLPNSGPFCSLEGIRDMTLAAEDLGYDAVCPHDHVTWGESDRYHFYAGAMEQADLVEKPFDFYGVFSTLGYLAGITKRVRLIPAAICLAWRHPLQLAREAATIYALSEGRFVLCVCGGNVRKDFESLGVPWEERGRRTAESLKALRAIIDAPGPVSFDGEFFKFSDVELQPHPTGMQLWYGGTTEIAVKRTARYCDGWWPAAGPEYFQAQVPRVYDLAAQYGRPDAKFESAIVVRSCIADTDDAAMAIGRRTFELDYEAEWLKRHDIPDVSGTWFYGPPEHIAPRILAFEQSGCDLICIAVIENSVDGMIAQMRRFAEEVIPLYESLRG